MENSTKENLHSINERTIYKACRKCPICNSDQIQSLGMNAHVKFESTHETFKGSFPLITHICHDCGYLVFFMEGDTQPGTIVREYEGE